MRGARGANGDTVSPDAPARRRSRLVRFAATWTAVMVLALAGASSAVTYMWIKKLPTQYEIDATEILLVPKPTSNNPYSYFPRAVIFTAQVVAARVNQQAVRAKILAAGALPDYTVAIQDDGNQWGPIYDRPNILITVHGTDADRVTATAQILVRQVQQTLNTMQAQTRAPAKSWIGTQTFGADSVSVLHGRRSRTLAALAAISLWGSALGLRLARRWWRRRPLSRAVTRFTVARTRIVSVARRRTVHAGRRNAPPSARGVAANSGRP